MPDLHLGLIGDTIALSKAPLLHRLAGAQNGLEVRYDLLVPREMGQDFEAVFEGARAAGYRGLNITYPYKERAAGLVRIAEPLVRAMGAVNTVIFGDGAPQGYNTDFSGFVAAYRHVLGKAAPGVVAMIGAGGVGRAVGFGLLRLGARDLRIVDSDKAKAQALAAALRAAEPSAAIRVTDSPEEAVPGADGLVNCTPVGMAGHPGTPLPPALMSGARWAFDAVYTPADTQFLNDARACGLQIIPGYELFFFQGVDAWAIFAGLPLDQAALRAALANG